MGNRLLAPTVSLILLVLYMFCGCRKEPKKSGDVPASSMTPLTSNALEWHAVTNDLSLLHPQMLKILRKCMCFLVVEDGNERAAVIARVPTSIFGSNIADALMRIHVEYYQGRDGDVFTLYTVVAISPKDFYSVETWIFPYDDDKPPHPLDRSRRKRLELLLGQEDVPVLIVDENDQLRYTGKISYTNTQRQKFPVLRQRLKNYKGKRISSSQLKSVVLEYVNSVSDDTLAQRFEILLLEQ